MSTDFTKPVVTDSYASILPSLVAELQDLARALDPVLTGNHTNIPTGSMRYVAANSNWERYNGTSWVTTTAAGANLYAVNISGNAATSTAAANITGVAAVLNGGTGGATVAAAAFVSKTANNGYSIANTSGQIVKVASSIPGGDVSEELICPVGGTTVVQYMTNNNAATDAKRWRHYVDNSGALIFDTVNEAFSSSRAVFSVGRSAIEPTLMTLMGSTGRVRVGFGTADDGVTSLQVSTLKVAGATVGLGGGALATNVCCGVSALGANTTGTSNTAVGASALGANTSGYANIAIGASSLAQNTTGNRNTAVGNNSLKSNTAAVANTGFGCDSLTANTTGNSNTAIGLNSLSQNTTGSENTAIGLNALFSSSVFNGATGVGAYAEVTAGYQVQLGASFSTTYVYGTVQNRSDLRDKSDVRDTILGLEFIKSLRPVDYKWDMRCDYKTAPPVAPKPVDKNATDKEIEAHKIADKKYSELMAKWLTSVKNENLKNDGSKKRSRYHHGLIAQDVEAVIKKSGVDFGGFQDHKKSGGDDVMSIGYDEFVAPLIKAVQELAAQNVALSDRLKKLEH